MADSVPQVLLLPLFLSLLLCCQSSRIVDVTPFPASSSSSSSSSSPPGHRHHRHHHHHRHYHGEQHQSEKEAAVKQEDEKLVRGSPLSQRDGGQVEDRAEEGQRGSAPALGERVTNAPAASTSQRPPPVVDSQSAALVRDESVGAKEEEKEGEASDSSHPRDASTLGDPAHRHEDEEKGVLEQFQDAQSTAGDTPPSAHTTVTPPSPLVVSQSDRSRSDEERVPPPEDNPEQQSTTERTVLDRGDGLAVNEDNDEEEEEEAEGDGVEDSDAPQVEAMSESPAKSNDDKLLNRPSWRIQIAGSDEEGEEDNDDDDDAKVENEDDEKKEDHNVKEDIPSSDVEDNRSRHRLNHRKEPGSKKSQDGPNPVLDPENKPDPDKNKKKNKKNRKMSIKTPIVKGKKRMAGKKMKKEKDPVEGKKVVVNVKRKMNYGKHRKNKPSLSKGCPGCTETEKKMFGARELHKQVLKAQLLDKLRLVPTFQRQPWPPKLPDQVFPEDVQRDQHGVDGGQDDDRYYAKPTQLLLFGRDLGPHHRLKKPATGSYKFEVRGRVRGSVRSARLWVYKMGDANDVHGQTLVVTELHLSKRRRLRERSLVARLDTRVREGWVSFDVTRLVRRWAESVKERGVSSPFPSSSSPFQLLAIRCKTCHRTNYRAIFGVKSHFRPVLVIREAEENQVSRKERSACDPTSGCCKFDMLVSFEELGIHEIFRPLTIKADYCFGTCHLPDQHHYNHTRIIQRMRFTSDHSQNVTLRQRLEPCCVPVVLREATIYHYLNSGLDSQVSLVPNLLVDRCGCA